MSNKNYTGDMGMIAEVIGQESTRKLMTQLGGIYIYIPKASADDIAEELKTNGYIAKDVAVKFNVSLSRVYKILKQLRFDARVTQHKLFE